MKRMERRIRLSQSSRPLAGTRIEAAGFVQSVEIVQTVAKPTKFMQRPRSASVANVSQTPKRANAANALAREAAQIKRLRPPYWSFIRERPRLGISPSIGSRCMEEVRTVPLGPVHLPFSRTRSILELSIRSAAERNHS
jgi:hypothetical protein